MAFDFVHHCELRDYLEDVSQQLEAFLNQDQVGELTNLIDHLEQPIAQEFVNQEACQPFVELADGCISQSEPPAQVSQVTSGQTSACSIQQVFGGDQQQQQRFDQNAQVYYQYSSEQIAQTPVDCAYCDWLSQAYSSANGNTFNALLFNGATYQGHCQQVAGGGPPAIGTNWLAS